MEHALDIREIRTRLGMTQAQLGDAIGVDQSTISNWENGSPPRGPARKLLIKLAASRPKRTDPTAKPQPEKAVA